MNSVKIRNIEIGTGMPKICVPIVGTTKEEILKAAEDIRHTSADLVEWRVDWYEEVFEFYKVEETAKELRGVLGEVPILFTFRTAKEGGEKEIGIEEYMQLNKMIASAGCVDLIDVEFFSGDVIVKELITAAHENGVKVIASNHDFQKTPEKEEIIERLYKMQKIGADILKIAVMPQSMQDVLILLEATEEMRRCYAEKPVVTMSMSQMGILSRIAGEAFGSAITFGALGKVSAPGQINVEELKKIIGILHKKN